SAILQDLTHHGPIGEAQDVVEVPAGVFRITARVRASEHGDRAARAEQVAERVGQQGGFGEGPDEHQVDVGRQLADEVLEAGIADEGYVVPFRLTPHADHLRHDAREVGVHDARVQGTRGTARNEVDDADAKLTHLLPHDG